MVNNPIELDTPNIYTWENPGLQGLSKVSANIAGVDLGWSLKEDKALIFF